MNKYINRALVSFSGRCPLQCKHCYTLDNDCAEIKNDMHEIEHIIESLRESTFDIIYVSHDRENFVNEQAGVKLTEQLYETYNCSILIITRQCLSQETVRQLAVLSNKMTENKHSLFIAVSIPANSSYGITENVGCIATPLERCQTIKILHQYGLKTILLARPIFPSSIIPVDEVIEMIVSYHEYIDAVVASGIAVNKPIIARLAIDDKGFKYLPGNNAEFLVGSSAKDIKYVDVSSELAAIQNVCKEYGITFSTHSMEALNNLKI